MRKKRSGVLRRFIRIQGRRVVLFPHLIPSRERPVESLVSRRPVYDRAWTETEAPAKLGAELSACAI
jgi:hypothetical protein